MSEGAEDAVTARTDAGPRIAILGAGPVGLEAALAAVEAGLPFRCYEAASEVAGHVRDWGHVRLFTPWDLNVSPRARRHLRRAGHDVPEGDECPTGEEMVRRVLEPLARLPEVEPRLRLGTEVVAVARDGMLKHEAVGDPERGRRPFRLLLEGPSGEERVERADVVLDCTGSYGRPRPLGAGGIPAPGERRVEDLIVRRIPDLDREADRWAGRTVLTVGAGHSAQTAVRDLAELAERRPGTRVVWALRRRNPGWGRVPDDPLVERERLTRRAEELASGASPAVEAIRGVTVEALERRNGRVAARLGPTAGRSGESDGREGRWVEADRILGLTGAVGDHLLYRELQVHECYATTGPMKLAATLMEEDSADCLDQTSHGVETLANPEPDFFILGDKSYGRNNTFLVRVGWEQVDEVFGHLAAADGSRDGGLAAGGG